MKIQIQLEPGDTVEVTRAGTAGLQRVDVALASDGALTVHTCNSTEVPGLGTLGETRLTGEHPGPIRIGGPVPDPDAP